MYAAYLTATLLAATLTSCVAVANFIGHDYPKAQADRLRIPHTWMKPFGTLMAAATIGLLAGLIIPPLGTLAALGLVLYFIGALIAHLRVHDHNLGPWAFCFAVSATALTTNLAYH
jgi:hypothetical protein